MGLMKCKCAVKEPSHIFFLVKQQKSKRNCDFLSPNKNSLPYPANVNSFRMDLYSLWSFLALLESLNLSFPVRINSLVCSSSVTTAFSWTIRDVLQNPSGMGTKFECYMLKVFRRHQLTTLSLFWIVVLQMLVLTTITKHTILRGSWQLWVCFHVKTGGSAEASPFRKSTIGLFYSFCCISYEVTKQIWRNSM